MKRIQLFEIEDFPWFPNFLRKYLMQLLYRFHQLLGSAEVAATQIEALFQKSNFSKITDLCSGNGQLAISVFEKLSLPIEQFTVTDLYPTSFHNSSDKTSGLRFQSEPTDALTYRPEAGELITMLAAFHHFSEEETQQILERVMAQNAALMVLEISANDYPKFLWWTAIPINMLSSLVLTLFVKKWSLGQFFFTYVIPILPLVFEWDGAVSNARTYGVDDLKILLSRCSLPDHYRYEILPVKRKATLLAFHLYPLK